MPSSIHAAAVVWPLVQAAGFLYDKSMRFRSLGLLLLAFVFPAGFAAGAPQYYFGADLSYVNELEDCGATYKAQDTKRDPFGLLHERGANLVRVRLWNDAKWTRYSNLADVKKTISRARREGMQVLLDFHYSDDWADGDKQIIPKAWEKITDTDKLAQALYDFTYRSLMALDKEGLMPELVQVGNETNGEILSTLERAKEPINWARNATLLNAGIRAVRDAGASSRIRPRVMLHIAQPENVEPWFAAAKEAGVTDFDLIGISYYRKWSSQGLSGLAAVINRLRHTYPADVLLVEAAYPWTLDAADSLSNILGQDSLLPEYPATALAQRRYLLDLSQLVIANGGVGVVYWEPAWISSSCSTRWGTGSSWENAALFDFEGELLPGADYLAHPYVYPVDVELRMAQPQGDAKAMRFLAADFLGGQVVPMQSHADGLRFRTRLMPGTRIRFQMYDSPDRKTPLLVADPADPEGFAHAVVGLDATIIDLRKRASQAAANAESQRPNACASCGTASTGVTSPGNFNADWDFHRFDTRPAKGFRVTDVPDSEWEKVTLPHTARIEPRIVNDQWQGDAVYRKRFAANESWRGKRVWLRFEAAMNKADVWFNGKRVTTHLGGYLPFVVDLTKRLRFDGDNEIVVWLDNRDNPVTGPKPLKILDFNTYGGLYRDVSLIVKDPLHVTDEMLANRKAGGGVFVTYPVATAERAEVAVQTHVRNDSRGPETFRVVHLLWDGERMVARGESQTIELSPGHHTHNSLRIPVERPRLWSPRSPHLYRLVTRIESQGQVRDERHTRIGIRRFEITREAFTINGERVFLRGVNRHQEYPYVGYAISGAADYRDAKRIKEAGFDFVRLSHYPHSPAFMAAADELGLVILNSILGWQFFNDDPAFSRQVRQTCRDMIRRDRNHPSVIAWECSLNETKMPVSLVRDLHAIVHEEYPGDQAYSAGWQNDGYDVYIQARQHRIEHYEPPDRPYLVSEYGDWEYYALNAGFQQEAWANLLPESRTSRQLLSDGEIRLLQQAKNVQEAHNDNFNVPAFADAYWVMFDYNRGYAEDLEASGVMTLERVPKPSYDFFRSQRDADELSVSFESGPMVRIASWWTPQSSTRIRVFANVDEVELFVNGRSLGRQKPDRDRMSRNLRHAPFSFDVGEFVPGELEAVGFIKGKAVASHVVTTPEEIDHLEVEIDDAGVCAEPGDLVFVRARFVDRSGTTVPISGREVHFEALESLAVVGSPWIASEAGVASALLRVQTLEGAELTAMSHPLITRYKPDSATRCRRRI
jgi:beta-galactosidase